MPTNTAMDILKAFKLKQQQNPAADRSTLFKYLLWDRFSGKMVTDAEMEDMVRNAGSLANLTLMVLQKEKPAMEDSRLEASARDAINQYFRMNYPEGLK